MSKPSLEALTTVPETTAGLLAWDFCGEWVFTENPFSRHAETALNTEIDSCHFH